MKVYRDDVARVHIRCRDAQLFEGADAFQAALGIEDGALWSLKWAIKYCPEGTVTLLHSRADWADE